MKVSDKYYDEVFEFDGEWGVPSACGLKIIGHGDLAVIVVTELYQDNPGTSVTYAGVSLRDQICRRKGIDPDRAIYIECNPDTNSKLSFYDEEYFKVDFATSASPTRAQYTRLSREQIIDLTGEGREEC